MSTICRREAAVSWARQQLPDQPWQTETISSDASFRSYYRLRHQAQSYVVMDAPPEHESVHAFVDIARRLRAAGLHAPAVIAQHLDEGFLLLEDLGSQPYHHVLQPGNADSLFGDALHALQILQSRGDAQGLPAYDQARMNAEVKLFPDWFLTHHWRVEPTADEKDDWDGLCTQVIQACLDQPQVFCHRDYMPRNLMVSEPNPGIIDFQDAVAGPISYDPICLFRDAFLSWPAERVDQWLEFYRQRAHAVGLPVPDAPDDWRRLCDWMGVQRHLKVIGIFARIRYRDGKPAYLDDAPRFFGYLETAFARNTELAPLTRLIASWRQRARPAQ